MYVEVWAQLAKQQLRPKYRGDLCYAVTKTQAAHAREGTFLHLENIHLTKKKKKNSRPTFLTPIRAAQPLHKGAQRKAMHYFCSLFQTSRTALVLPAWTHLVHIRSFPDSSFHLRHGLVSPHRQLEVGAMEGLDVDCQRRASRGILPAPLR